MNSGWFETDGKTTREIPVGWRKEWAFENVYAWQWYGPPHSLWVNLCVLGYEPTREQASEIEQRFADAPEPAPPSPAAIKAGNQLAAKMDLEEARLRALAEPPK